MPSGGKARTAEALASDLNLDDFYAEMLLTDLARAVVLLLLAGALGPAEVFVFRDVSV